METLPFCLIYYEWGRFQRIERLSFQIRPTRDRASARVGRDNAIVGLFGEIYAHRFTYRRPFATGLGELASG